MTTGGARYGALAGLFAVALFALAGLLIGPRPAADASGSEVAEFLSDERTRIQLGCAVSAACTPFLTWFFATILSLSRRAGPAAEHAGAVVFGCGLVFIALYLVDVGALAVSALRPETMAAAPELASALHDVEWLLAAMAAFTMSALLVGCAVMSLTLAVLWPRWIGWLALAGAVAYGLRTGALFTTDGAFAADGPLGFWTPVAAVTGWIVVASLSLARTRGGTAS